MKRNSKVASGGVVCFIVPPLTLKIKERKQREDARTESGRCACVGCYPGEAALTFENRESRQRDFCDIFNESFDCVNMPLITAVLHCLSLLSITAHFSSFLGMIQICFIFIIILYCILHIT